MKTSSAKSKGRRLQQYVRDFLLEYYKKDGLVVGDIESTIMGDHGEDIKLSPAAEKIIPFSIECKNTEGFNRNSTIKQVEAYVKPGRIPLIIFKKNRSNVYSILKYDNFKALNINYDNIVEIKKSSFNIWNELKMNDVIKFYKDEIPYVALEFKKLFL